MIRRYDFVIICVEWWYKQNVWRHWKTSGVNGVLRTESKSFARLYPGIWTPFLAMHILLILLLGGNNENVYWPYNGPTRSQTVPIFLFDCHYWEADSHWGVFYDNYYFTQMIISDNSYMNGKVQYSLSQIFTSHTRYELSGCNMCYIYSCWTVL